MADDLTEFLRAAARRPFSWSQWDCFSWLGSWVAVRHGVDPADALRPLYSTQRGAMRLIRRHGSREAVIEACTAPLGIGRTDDPQAGDIALVDAPEGHIGAIVTGKFTACIGPDGLRFRQVPIIAAWRV